MHQTLRGALFSLAAFGIYATHDAAVKFLGASYAPVQTLFFTTLFSFPLAMFVLMRDKTPGTLRPRHPWWMGFRTVATLINGVTGFYAFANLPLAQAYAIFFAMPLLITVLSIPMLGEKVGPRRWAAVLVGLIGVAIAVWPQKGATGAAFSTGHLAALVAACGGAFNSIIVRKIGNDERPVVVMLYPMTANYLAMGAALAFFYKPMPAEHLGLLALMSVFGFLGGLVIIAAYRAAEAAAVAPMQYSQILWAAAYGYFLFGEVPGRNTTIGAAVIIASGIFILFRERARGDESLSPVGRTRLRPDTGAAPRPFIIARLFEGRRPGGAAK